MKVQCGLYVLLICSCARRSRAPLLNPSDVLLSVSLFCPGTHKLCVYTAAVEGLIENLGELSFWLGLPVQNLDSEFNDIFWGGTIKGQIRGYLVQHP